VHVIADVVHVITVHVFESVGINPLPSTTLPHADAERAHVPNDPVMVKVVPSVPSLGEMPVTDIAVA
jgi:hypothetical protein